MPTDLPFLLAVGVAILALLVALAGLWWYSGEPEQHHGPWERPANAAPQSPLPPGYRLVLDLAESDWTDTEGWTQLIGRLEAIAGRLDAGPPPVPPPRTPDRGWFDAELGRLEGSVRVGVPASSPGPGAPADPHTPIRLPEGPPQ